MMQSNYFHSSMPNLERLPSRKGPEVPPIPGERAQTPEQRAAALERLKNIKKEAKETLARASEEARRLSKRLRLGEQKALAEEEQANAEGMPVESPSVAKKGLFGRLAKLFRRSPEKAEFKRMMKEGKKMARVEKEEAAAWAVHEKEEALAQMTVAEHEAAFGKAGAKAAERARKAEAAEAAAAGKRARTEMAEEFAAMKEREGKMSAEAKRAEGYMREGNERFMELIAEGKEPEEAVRLMGPTMAELAAAGLRRAGEQAKRAGGAAARGLDVGLGWTEKQLTGSRGLLAHGVETYNKASKAVNEKLDDLTLAAGRGVAKGARAGVEAAKFVRAQTKRGTTVSEAARSVAESAAALRARTTGRGPTIGEAARMGKEVIGRGVGKAGELAAAGLEKGAGLTAAGLEKAAAKARGFEQRRGRKPDEEEELGPVEIEEEAVMEGAPESIDIASAVAEAADKRRLPRNFDEELRRLISFKADSHKLYTPAIDAIERLIEGTGNESDAHVRELYFDGWTNAQLEALVERAEGGVNQLEFRATLKNLVSWAKRYPVAYEREMDNIKRYAAGQNLEGRAVKYPRWTNEDFQALLNEVTGQVERQNARRTASNE